MQHIAEIGSLPGTVGESGVDSLCESPPRLEGEETHAGRQGTIDPALTLGLVRQ